jgi:hypothetical protein
MFWSKSAEALLMSEKNKALFRVSVSITNFGHIQRN